LALASFWLTLDLGRVLDLGRILLPLGQLRNNILNLYKRFRKVEVQLGVQ
jgi:hypothetical protein